MKRKTESVDTISYTEARNNLANAMIRVCEDRAPIIITRQNGSPAVLMSLEDFRSIEETVYLLRNPKNAKRLVESIDQLSSGKVRKRKLVQ